MEYLQMRFGLCLKYCLVGIILGVILGTVSTLDFSTQTAAAPTESSSSYPLAVTFPLVTIQSSTPLNTQLALPWGAFYLPVEIAIQNGMTGIITDEKLDQIDQILSTAQAANVKVIVTLGSVDECEYYASNTIIDYERALTDKKIAIFVLIYRVGGYEQLKSYINDGTLAAVRVFDEVHYAGHCGDDLGIPYQLTWCDGGRVLNGLPIGTDDEPGFADLLHELKKRLPENLPIGSTSQPSYMGLVASRINTLRQRENLPPLAANSILAHSGYTSDSDDADQTIRQKIECDASGFPNSELIFFLGNVSCNKNSDNFSWWNDYIDGCQAQSLEFYASWSWGSGAAGNFQTRLEDLLDGGVSNGEVTITLDTVRQACSHMD